MSSFSPLEDITPTSFRFLLKFLKGIMGLPPKRFRERHISEVPEQNPTNVWTSVTRLCGVCLHQFWDDLDQASRNYKSDKKRSREGV